MTQGLNPGLPYCGQTLYHLSHQGISHQLHALHVVHQQIGPWLQGTILAWAAEGIHEVSGQKTRHPSLAAVSHLSLQSPMRLSGKRKEPWPRLNFPLIFPNITPKYMTVINWKMSANSLKWIGCERELAWKKKGARDWKQESLRVQILSRK